MLIYFETGLGARLDEARDLGSGIREKLKEVGTYQGIQVARKATPEDIAWVSSMGGWVPEKYRKEKNDRDQGSLLRSKNRRKSR